MPQVRSRINWSHPRAPRPVLNKKDSIMRSLILWIIGVPISLILLIGLFTHF